MPRVHQSGLKKPPDQVRRRNSKLVTNLPPEGRPGDAPEWPLPAAMTTREAEIWDEVWSMPQAVIWEQWHQEPIVAQYVQLVVRCEAPDAGATLMAQRRMLQQELGMTPKSLFGLQWTLAPIESEIQGEVSDLEAYREALGA